MKGVKWKFYAKLSALLMSLFAIFAINSANTSAIDVSNANVRRAYSHSGLGYVVNNENVGSISLPYTIFSYDSKAVKKLFGLMVATNTVDNQNNKYKTISVTFTIEQSTLTAYSNPIQSPNYTFQVTASGSVYNGSCNNTAWGSGNNWGRTWTCAANFSNYESVQSFSLVLGELNGNTMDSNAFIQVRPAVGSTDPYYFAATATSLSYTIVSSADPLLAGQQQTTDAVNSVNDTLQQQNQQDQQDREDLENQQSSAEDSADSSSEQAESTGSTLLQAFTGFVGALTSSSASDCFIDFNIMGYLNGGAVDLCQLSIPPALQAIGSLILIGFCVPLSIATAKKLIGLFRSFQS